MTSTSRAFIVVLVIGGLFSSTLLAGPTLWFTAPGPKTGLIPQSSETVQVPQTEPGTDTPIRVVAGLQATFSLASAIAKGTRIAVIYPFPEQTRMEAQYRYLADHSTTIQPTAQGSVAAITVRDAWPADPLFPVFREHNVRMIEIETCRPVEPGRRSIAVFTRQSGAYAPRSSEEKPMPYVWLSLGNATRMAEIIAEDFMRIDPQDAWRLADNLARLKHRLFALRSRYQDTFAEIETLAAVTLCQDFRYLTGEFQIDVIDFEPKPEFRWSEDDCQDLSRVLTENGIKVVIHKWHPSRPILDAIEAAGARLVVLHTMDPPVEHDPHSARTDYLGVMEGNLRSLHEAFADSQ